MSLNQPTISTPFMIKGVVGSPYVSAYINAFECLFSSVSWEDSDKDNTAIFLYIIDPDNMENSQIAQDKLAFSLQCHNLPPLKSIEISKIENKNWVEITQNSVDTCIGPFHISHNNKGVSDGMIPIIITPGAAFGTGTHPTTKGCLLAMSKLQDFPFSKILDMGCGSGILSIAAAKIYQNSMVLSVDIDPLAIKTTKNNAKINNTSTVVTQESNVFHNANSLQFDLILSNILANPLCEMAPNFRKTLSKGGYLIISGFLKNALNDVIECYTKQNILIHNKLEIDGWYTLTLKHA